MKKIIDEIAASINNIGAESARAVFTNPDYEPVDFSLKNFHEIRPVEAGNKTAFVDGGSAPIISSPGFCVHFVRIYSVIYTANKKTKSLKQEFFVLVSLKKSDKLNFAVRLFPAGENDFNPDLDDLEFSILDPTLRSEGQSVNIQSVANAVRRFAELMFAGQVLDLLGQNDMLLIDGTLQPNVTYEKKYVELLLEKASSRSVVVCGVSKTSQLFTDAGDSVQSALQKLTGLPLWYYYPIASTRTQVDIFIAKLHKASKYVFRIDLQKGTAPEEIFGILASNSKDPVFLGYPYGLVHADRCARVSNSEREYLRTLFSSKIDIGKLEAALDAHSMLDNIA
jgi:hypothetical protein